MSQNYNSDDLLKTLDRLNFKYNHMTCKSIQEIERTFIEHFEYIVDTVIWKVLTQRKQELQERNYIINLHRSLPDSSNAAPFIKMELSPIPARHPDDAYNEAKSIPVYEWVARANARAECVEILHYPHAVDHQRIEGRMLRTFRNLWHIDRIRADQLTTEYVESRIDKWMIISVQNYLRQICLDKYKITLAKRWEDHHISLIMFIFMFIFVSFLSWSTWKIWPLASLIAITSIVLAVYCVIEEYKRNKEEFVINNKTKFIYIIYEYVRDSVFIILILCLCFAIILRFVLPSPYGQISAIAVIAISWVMAAVHYIRLFWANDIARTFWKISVFVGSVAMIPLSRLLAGTVIQQMTALSADAIPVAWDIIALLYIIILVIVAVFVISAFLYLVFMFSWTVGKATLGLALFFALIVGLGRPAAIYAEKSLLLFTDDIISWVFVQNCQEVNEQSAPVFMCKNVSEGAYIRVFQGDQVFEARRQERVFDSSEKVADKYNFLHVGDRKTLECTGFSM